jgi:putative transcription factor
VRLAQPAQIAEYESGKAVPNTALLAKMERALGIKLRGDAKLIGTPLGGPKKK